MVEAVQAALIGARYQSCLPQRAGVIGIALILLASEAHAQMPNNVAYPIPRTGTGVRYTLDFARGNRDAGEATYAGVRIAPP